MYVMHIQTFQTDLEGRRPPSATGKGIIHILAEQLFTFCVKPKEFLQ